MILKFPNKERGFFNIWPKNLKALQSQKMKKFRFQIPCVIKQCHVSIQTYPLKEKSWSNRSPNLWDSTASKCHRSVGKKWKSATRKLRHDYRVILKILRDSEGSLWKDNLEFTHHLVLKSIKEVRKFALIS